MYNRHAIIIIREMGRRRMITMGLLKKYVCMYNIRLINVWLWYVAKAKVFIEDGSW